MPMYDANVWVEITIPIGIEAETQAEALATAKTYIMEQTVVDTVCLHKSVDNFEIQSVRKR